MNIPRQHNQKEKQYRITLLRVGKVTVEAESQSEAIQKAVSMGQGEIHWLSEEDGLPGGYLVGLIEQLKGSGPDEETDCTQHG